MATRNTRQRASVTVLSRQHRRAGTSKKQNPAAAGMPPELRADSLVAIDVARASIDVSASRWYELVQRRIAPQPVIKSNRFTRWRVADLIQFAQRVAERGELA